MLQAQGESPRIRVAIVGAGIAGLTLAVALNAFDSEHKIVIDLYESASELSEVGAGINVWPRTWQVLKEIGLGDALIPFFDHFPDLEPRVIFEIRKSDQKNGFKVIDIMRNGGVLRIHRADFQRCLIKHLPVSGSGVSINSPCTLHLCHKLIDYRYTSDITSAGPTPTSPDLHHRLSGPLTLFFEDKPSQTCDILIGADGIKSTIRPEFLARLPNPEKYRNFVEPIWSGTIVYRGLVGSEELAKVFPGHKALGHPGIMYIGKKKHTVVYPISGGKYINVVAAVHDKTKEGTAWEGPWNQEVPQSEFFDQFAGWEEEFQALIRCINRPTRWAVQTMNHLDLFAKGRVILMGDSAHAMVPHQGAGAGVGIEDAYILASLLTHPSTSHPLSMQHISRINHIYNKNRVPQAISRSKASVYQGSLYTLESPGFERFKAGDEVPEDMLVEVFRLAERNWAWTTSDPFVDQRQAVEELMGGRAHL